MTRGTLRIFRCPEQFTAVGQLGAQDPGSAIRAKRIEIAVALQDQHFKCAIAIILFQLLELSVSQGSDAVFKCAIAIILFQLLESVVVLAKVCVDNRQTVVWLCCHLRKKRRRLISWPIPTHTARAIR